MMEKRKANLRHERNEVVQRFRTTRHKVIRFIKNNPKNIFITMIALNVLSLAFNIAYYNFTIKSAKVSYKQMSDKLFDVEDPVIQKKQDLTIIQQAGNYFEMKKDLDKLKEYQENKKLTRQDSLEIKRIIKKYNLK